MRHIKISQIIFHLIKKVEKYIGTCITNFLSQILRKPNLSPIIKMSHSKYDEGRTTTWFLIGEGEHFPLIVSIALESM